MLNDYHTMQEIVFNTLKEKIISGEYKPGQRLVANDLAKALHVSRMPIREALARLASSGLVELIPHKGAIVNELTLEDYDEIFHLRAVLEGLASRLACPHITDEDILEMEDINQEINEMIGENGDHVFQSVNRKFHSILWEKSNSKRLKTLCSNLYDESSQYRNMSIHLPGRLEGIVAEHSSIISALQEKTPEEVEKIVIQHYENTLSWLLKNSIKIVY